jgi:hypothetical protein
MGRAVRYQEIWRRLAIADEGFIGGHAGLAPDLAGVCGLGRAGGLAAIGAPEACLEWSRSQALVRAARGPGNATHSRSGRSSHQCSTASGLADRPGSDVPVRASELDPAPSPSSSTAVPRDQRTNSLGFPCTSSASSSRSPRSACPPSLLRPSLGPSPDPSGPPTRPAGAVAAGRTPIPDEAGRRLPSARTGSPTRPIDGFPVRRGRSRRGKPTTQPRRRSAWRPG